MTAGFTKIHTNALAPAGDGTIRGTKVTSQAVVTFPIPPRRFTKVYVQILMAPTPDFSWIEDMTTFKNILFPHDISYNSIGAVRQESDDTYVDSGHSQRNQRWEFPIMEYDVAYGVRTMEQLHALNSFFRNTRGTVFGFLYLDHFDFQSNQAIRTEARAPDPITMLDQRIGTGFNLTYKYQLIKTYKTPTVDGTDDSTATRIISKPMRGAGNVLIALNALAYTFWTVNYDTGVIEFTPPLSRTFTHTITITDRNTTNGNVTLTGVAGDFTGFPGGRLVRVQGFNNPANNTQLTDSIPITGGTGDASFINVTMPLGFGVAESKASGVTVSLHPAPITGTIITAGYKFWVPCKFNTKRLPFALEEYGIGGAADVKLVELRPQETLP